MSCWCISVCVCGSVLTCHVAVSMFVSVLRGHVKQIHVAVSVIVSVLMCHVAVSVFVSTDMSCSV